MHAFVERCRDIAKAAHPKLWAALAVTIALATAVHLAGAGGAA